MRSAGVVCAAAARLAGHGPPDVRPLSGFITPTTCLDSPSPAPTPSPPPGHPAPGRGMIRTLRHSSAPRRPPRHAECSIAGSGRIKFELLSGNDRRALAGTPHDCHFPAPPSTSRAARFPQSTQGHYQRRLRH